MSTSRQPAEFEKAKYSLYSALVFFIIAAPFTYKIVQSVLGRLVTIATPTGCPTYVGVGVHSIVFGLIVFAMMHLRI
jgi:hypothetical protein